MTQGSPLYRPTPSMRVAVWWVSWITAHTPAALSRPVTMNRVDRRPSGSIRRMIWVEVNWKMMEYKAVSQPNSSPATTSMTTLPHRM